MLLERIIEQIKEYKKMGDKETNSQIMYMVLARLHDINVEQLRAIPQKTFEELFLFVPEYCNSLSTQNQEDYIRWAKAVFESYRNNRDILRNLSSLIDNAKSEVDRKSLTIKHPEEYRCVTTEESGKINKSILEKCSRLAELELTHTRGTITLDSYIQVLNKDIQDYYRKQGRFWHLAEKHSSIKTYIKSNLSEFIRIYDELDKLAQQFFNKGLYILGRECLSIKSYYGYGTSLEIANYPLDKLLEPLVQFNARELSIRKANKEIKPQWQSYKHQLYETRIKTAQKLVELNSLEGTARAKTMQAIQEELRIAYLRITTSILTTIQSILGEPPGGICILAFGSISRGDINGDSDIEPGFILKEGLSGKDLERAEQYIKNFKQLWEFEMITLGESENNYAGFHFDGGSGHDVFNNCEEYANYVVSNIATENESEIDNTKLRPLYIFGDKTLSDRAKDLIKRKLKNEPLGKEAKIRILNKIAYAIANPDSLDGGITAKEKLEPKKKIIQLLVWAITQYAINNGLPKNHSVHPFDILDWLSREQFLAEDYINQCRNKLCWLYEQRLRQSIAKFTLKPIPELSNQEVQKELSIIDKEVLKPFGLLLKILAKDNPPHLSKNIDPRTLSKSDAPTNLNVKSIAANDKSATVQERKNPISPNQQNLSRAAALPAKASAPIPPNSSPRLNNTSNSWFTKMKVKLPDINPAENKSLLDDNNDEMKKIIKRVQKNDVTLTNISNSMFKWRPQNNEIIALLDALKKNVCVTHLTDMYSDDDDPAVREAYVDMFKNNHSIYKVSLNLPTARDASTITRIASALRDNKSITEIHFSGTNLYAAEEKSLGDILDDNYTLLYISDLIRGHIEEIKISSLRTRNISLAVDASEAAKKGDIPTLQKKLIQGVSLFASLQILDKSEEGGLLFITAIVNNQEAVLQFLINEVRKRGLFINIANLENCEDKTVLEYAKKSGNPKMLELLTSTQTQSTLQTTHSNPMSKDNNTKQVLPESVKPVARPINAEETAQLIHAGKLDILTVLDKIDTDELKEQIINELDFSKIKVNFALLFKLLEKISFKNLKISNCDYLTDEHLKKILKHSSGLESLSLTNCNLIKGKDLLNTLEKYTPFIKNVYLTNMLNLILSVEKQFPVLAHLHTLHIENCPLTTTLAVITENLTHLELPNQNGTELLLIAPNLKVLDIRGWSNLDNFKNGEVILKMCAYRLEQIIHHTDFYLLLTLTTNLTSRIDTPPKKELKSNESFEAKKNDLYVFLGSDDEGLRNYISGLLLKYNPYTEFNTRDASDINARDAFDTLYIYEDKDIKYEILSDPMLTEQNIKQSNVHILCYRNNNQEDIDRINSYINKMQMIQKNNVDSTTQQPSIILINFTSPDSQLKPLANDLASNLSILHDRFNWELFCNKDQRYHAKDEMTMLEQKALLINSIKMCCLKIKSTNSPAKYNNIIEPDYNYYKYESHIKLDHYDAYLRRFDLICYTLSLNNNLATFEASRCQLTNLHIYRLLISLRGKKFFTRIYLSNNKIDDDAIDFVVDFLNQTKSMQVISLRENKFSKQSLELVYQTLETNERKNHLAKNATSLQTKPPSKPEKLEHKPVPNTPPRTTNDTNTSSKYANERERKEAELVERKKELDQRKRDLEQRKKEQEDRQKLEHKTVPNNPPSTAIVTHKFNTGRPHEWTPDLGNLYEAAKSGNLAETKRLTTNEVTMNIRFPFCGADETPLILASGSDSLETVQYLVSRGANIHLEDFFGETALCHAARRGKLAILKYLQSKGAKINHINKEKESPLFIAASKGHLEVVEYLHSEGLDIHLQNNEGETPFNIAARNKKYQVMRRLFSMGAKINQTNKKGETPLTKAARIGDIETVKLLLELDPDIDPSNNNGMNIFNGTICYDKGKLLAEQNKHDEAILYYDRAIASNPKKTDIQIWTSKCDSLRKLGRHSEIIQCCEQVLAINESADSASYEITCALYIKAKALAALNKQLEAIALFDKILEINSNDVDALNSKGFSLLALKRFADSLKCFEQILVEDRNNEDATYGKELAHALLLEEQGNYDDAIKRYGNIMSIMSENYSIYSRIALMYAKQRDHTKALSFAEKSIVQAKNTDEKIYAIDTKGTVLEKAKNFEAALACYEQILALDNNNAEALANSGFVYTQLNQYIQALVVSEKALTIDPKLPRAFLVKGLVAIHRNMYRDAHEYFFKALEFDPNQPTIYAYQGQLYSNQKEYIKAHECYQKALQICPTHTETLEFMKATRLAENLLHSTAPQPPAAPQPKQLIRIIYSDKQAGDSLNKPPAISTQKPISVLKLDPQFVPAAAGMGSRAPVQNRSASFSTSSPVSPHVSSGMWSDGVAKIKLSDTTVSPSVANRTNPIPTPASPIITPSISPRASTSGAPLYYSPRASISDVKNTNSLTTPASPILTSPISPRASTSGIPSSYSPRASTSGIPTPQRVILGNNRVTHNSINETEISRQQQTENRFGKK